MDKISAALLDFSEPLVNALSEHASEQARKMERHADDVRLVRDWKLTFRGDGEASLWAEAVVSRP